MTGPTVSVTLTVPFAAETRRLKLADRVATGSMAFAIVNKGTNPLVSPALASIAVAIETQLNAEFADEWGGRYIVRDTTGGPPPAPEEIPVILQDKLPIPGVLGYHELQTPAGKAIAYIAVGGLTDMTSGPDALSVTLSHELMETAADPTAARWQDMGQGTLLALETCDEVEDVTYLGANGVAVSDFLLQSYFVPGSIGPYDHLGVLTKQGQETPGGYSIRATMPTDVHDARRRFDAMLAQDPSNSHGASQRINRVVFVTQPPRAARFEKKAHVTSRTHRRGVRFPTEPLGVAARTAAFQAGVVARSTQI